MPRRKDLRGMEYIFFFLQSVESLFDRYRGLFEQVDGGDATNDETDFGQRWGLFSIIEAMAKLHNISINQTTELGSIEFLNWWAYMVEKANRDKKK